MKLTIARRAGFLLVLGIGGDVSSIMVRLQLAATGLLQCGRRSIYDLAAASSGGLPSRAVVNVKQVGSAFEK